MCFGFRRRIGPLVGRHSQLPLQTGPAPGPAVDVFGQAWMGAVLLQSSHEGRERPHSQKPTSLHHHEPNRSQPGAAYPSSEQILSHIKYVLLHEIFQILTSYKMSTTYGYLMNANLFFEMTYIFDARPKVCVSSRPKKHSNIRRITVHAFRLIFI